VQETEPDTGTETGTVSGTVFYNDGTTPLAGAEVQSVAEGDSEPIQGTITDDAGNFSMILNSGVYSLNGIVNGGSVGTHDDIKLHSINNV